jgi:hypothetical protein
MQSLRARFELAESVACGDSIFRWLRPSIARCSIPGTGVNRIKLPMKKKNDGFVSFAGLLHNFSLRVTLVRSFSICL